MRNDRGVRDRGPGGATPAGARFPLDDVVFGSAEHVRAIFTRAVTVASRALGVWLARSEVGVTLADRRATPAGEANGELQALRAMLRASVTAYVRRLRDSGATPERMLILVKAAVGETVSRGVEARTLTDDLVRWSIEAYFDD